MDDIKARFSTEANELLELFERRLLELEKQGQSSEAVAEIFRVIHTIKGTASMFGFVNIGKLTHDVEDIYDLVREGHMTFDKELMDLSFKIVDIIRELLKTGDELSSDDEAKMSAILDTVHQRLQNREESGHHEIEDQNSEVAEQKAYYYIRYQPDKDVLERGIDPLVVFEELEEEGEFLAYLDLNLVPSLTHFEPDEFFLAWDIFFTGAANTELVDDVFMFFLSHEYQVQTFTLAEIESLPNFGDILKKLSLYQIDNNILVQNLIKLSKACDAGEDKEEPEPVVGESPEKSMVADATETIRVEASKLDELINLVSDLVTINGQLEMKSEQIADYQLEKQVMELSKLAKRFRDNALNLRLVPIELLAVKMQRLVRDLSNELGKKTDFITEGTNTELDKSIVSRLEGPVLHIIRNCIDHAIETPEERLRQNKPEQGVVRFIAFYSGGNVFIQIQDDGKGIDPERVKNKAIEKGLIHHGESLTNAEAYNLIFEPGFSTAEKVSNVSGRGVGLDSVRKEIADMRGQVDVESEVGLGTSFTIKLPLTLSIIDTLQTTIVGHTVLVPMEFIIKTERLNGGNSRHMSFEGEIIPIIDLHKLLDEKNELAKAPKVLIIKLYNRKYGITVDRIVRNHQAVVKPLGVYNRHHPFFSGSSIMGDGSLALILDINRLVKHQKEDIL
ncbi:MAG: chemotaxis protein CheA [Salinivirgaceae bacterium]|jgi:two-component system chemotaxis sensor kinase CheA|nr:chemotaxis protein CheA [Salinivirgaceae bacterium]